MATPYEWVTTGLNFASGVANNIANVYLARQQNKWNIEQWQRENAYNLPSAQVQRLKDAGLNPGLIYGSGNIQNTSASSPQMESGAGMMSAPVLDPQMQAQTDYFHALADKTRVEAQTISQKLPEELQQLRTNNLVLQKKLEDFQHQWNLLDMEARYKEAARIKLDWDRMNGDRQYQLAVRDLESAINLRAKEGMLKDQQVRVTRAEADFLTRTMAARALGIDLQNDKMRSEIGLNSALAKEASRKATLLGMDIVNGYPEFVTNKNLGEWLDSNPTGFFQSAPTVARAINFGLQSLIGGIIKLK